MQLRKLRAAADAAAVAMHKEIVADIEPPATTDPKIAVMNLVQVSTGLYRPVLTTDPAHAYSTCGKWQDR